MVLKKRRKKAKEKVKIGENAQLGQRDRARRVEVYKKGRGEEDWK